jgi:hypothetical protein
VPVLVSPENFAVEVEQPAYLVWELPSICGAWTINSHVRVETIDNTFSVEFDGIDGRIQVVDNDFDGLNTGTIEFWFKTSTGAGYQKFVFKDGCVDIGITQDFGGGAQVFGEVGGVGNLGILESTNYADGEWHHVAFSWDGSTLRGYIDGEFKSSTGQSASQNNNGNNLFLGRRDTSEPLTGFMDEFRISNVARYTTESSFAIPTSDFSDDGNTLVLLHLNDGQGTDVIDSSSHENDGQLSGGASFSQDLPYSNSVVELELYSFKDDDFQFWDGDSWELYPITGVPAQYQGNQARVLVSLSPGVKYWKVRGGRG